MGRVRLLLSVTGAVASALLAMPPAMDAYEYSYARIVRLSYVQGDVQIYRPDRQSWEKASMNMPVQHGFSIGTNDGRAVVEFESGATAYIAENSVLEFTELALADGGRITKLTLTQGTATFYANPASYDSFTILAPQIQVAMPKRAEVRLDVFIDGGSVSVFQGNVNVDSPAGTRSVTKGETLAFSTASPDQVRMDRNPSADDWDQWVDGRENAYTTGTGHALQYTNAPVQYGMADLWNYGSWNYFAGYGYGWQPFGCSSIWAPFVDGQWVFYPSLGWTWVSFEPWGWTPYHFGSWIFTPSCGWFWLPGGFYYWNPAPVQWCRWHGRVGWRPRPPQVVATPVPARPLSAPPKAPIVLGGSNRLGARSSNRVVMTDAEGGTVEVLSAPPAPSGRFPKMPAGGGSAATGSASAGAAAGASALQAAGSTALVPTIPAAVRAGSTIVFDPAERRFVNGGSVPVVIVNGKPLAPAPRSAAPMPMHAPSTPATPSAPARVNPPPQPPRTVSPPRPAPPAPRSAPSPPRPPSSSVPHSSFSAPHSFAPPAPPAHPSGGGSGRPH